jgi:glutamine phosphoribosylpyrophosphate amidotransferase
MCGIIGYVGKEDAVPIIVDGLKKLEYRGYDSAGIAVYGKDGFDVVKQKGRLAALPAQVTVDVAGKDELREIEPLVGEFAEHFEMDAKSLLKDRFLVLKPNAKNPYKQLYVHN